jgi:hypothetical protein
MKNRQATLVISFFIRLLLIAIVGSGVEIGKQLKVV